MLKLVLAASALASVVCVANAEVVWLTHDLTLSLQQSTPASGVKPHKNVVQFFGVGRVLLEETQTAAGTVNNPVYQGNKNQGTNPLYNGDEAGSPDNPLEIGGFDSISFELSTPTFHVKSGGIIHRDLAARNLLLRTVNGDYSSVPSDQLAFGSDGPMDLRTTEGNPPIRWSAPEVLRLYYNGDANSDSWIDIEIGAGLDTGVVPMPGTLVVLGAAGLACTRRRR